MVPLLKATKQATHQLAFRDSASHNGCVQRLVLEPRPYQWLHSRQHSRHASPHPPRTALLRLPTRHTWWHIPIFNMSIKRKGLVKSKLKVPSSGADADYPTNRTIRHEAS